MQQALLEIISKRTEQYYRGIDFARIPILSFFLKSVQNFRVTGLDPAGPGFYILNKLYPAVVVPEHLSADSARFVDVIHTNGGYFGGSVSTGTVDFWPNGGQFQQGCQDPYDIPDSE